MNNAVEKALTKEAERIKARLKKIEEIMSYSVDDITDLEKRARPLIELYKKTEDMNTLYGIKGLAAKVEHIKAMLKLQEENGSFIVEKEKLKSDLDQIERELLYRKK